MLEDKVRRFLVGQENTDEPGGRTFIVAFSGGKDSACLLDLMCRLTGEQEAKAESRKGTRLKAVHIHHGIRKGSDDEEAFCREFCRERGVELKVFHVDALKKAEEEKKSLEEAARELRYECFEKCLEEFQEECQEEHLLDGKNGQAVILTAHHQMDQAETVLLHLLRGSGLKGLGGMEPVRGKFWRPMLEVSPEEIDAYVKEHHISHVEDESNQDVSFMRNRVRHQLIPLLKESYNENIVGTLARTAELLREDELLLDRAVPRENHETLDVKNWDQQPRALRYRRLRSYVGFCSGLTDVEQKHIEALDELAMGQSGRSTSLPKGLTAHKSYDILTIRDFDRPESEERLGDLEPVTEEMDIEAFRRLFPGEVPNRPYEVWLSLDEAKTLKWRTRKEGDFVLIRKTDEEGNVTFGRQKLQDFFINRKVPREVRKSIRMLTDGAHVLWVPGYRLSEGAKVTDKTQRVLHCFFPPEGDK